MWIRYGAVGFVAAVARTLNVADVHCNLLPRLQPFLKHPVVQVDQEVLKENSVSSNLYYTERRSDSSSAQMTLAPYIRSRVTRKSQFLHRNHVRDTLDFTSS